MDADHLVQMANRIATFFDAMPDREDAVEGVAQHIRKFWAPRMRRELLAHLHRQGDAGLHPLLARALHRREAALTPGAGG